jgi:hypothetical protein
VCSYRRIREEKACRLVAATAAAAAQDEATIDVGEQMAMRRTEWSRAPAVIDDRSDLGEELLTGKRIDADMRMSQSRRPVPIILDREPLKENTARRAEANHSKM